MSVYHLNGILGYTFPCNGPGFFKPKEKPYHLIFYQILEKIPGISVASYTNVLLARIV